MVILSHYPLEWNKLENVYFTHIQLTIWEKQKKSEVMKKVREIFVSVWFVIVGIESCPMKCDCSWFLNYSAVNINCRSKGLTKVPRNFPGNAIVLDLQSNKLLRIEAYAFSKLSKLVRLSLSNTSISYLAPNTFAGLNNLKSTYRFQTTVFRF